MPEPERGLIERSLRANYGRALGVLVGMCRHLDDAEDALQHAAEQAVRVWQRDMPDRPALWLIRVARNRLIDRARRDQVRARAARRIEPLVEARAEVPGHDPSEDGLLRLMFVCCHPALAPEAQLILILRVVLGFDISATARALLLTEATARKRLVRAKSKIRQAGIPFAIPQDAERGHRLAVVCDALYLMFNEGYSRPRTEMNTHLCTEALRLARQLSAVQRSDGNIRSLIALMLFGLARLPARYDEQGNFIPLDLQDRRLWHQPMLREGLATLDSVFLRRLPPTSLQLQAAISACHCAAASAESVDWSELAALYERLERLDPSPVVRINRSVALIYRGELQQAADLLKALENDNNLGAYAPYHAALGLLYERQGMRKEASAALRDAARLTDEVPERRYLEARARQISG